MTRPCKTERAAQQRALIAGALTALMGEGDYGSVTVSSLCRQAGIPRRTFYYYFESKEDVLIALVEDILRECELESMFLGREDRAALQEAFARFFRHWRDRRRRELEAIVKNHLEQVLLNRAMQGISSDVQWEKLISHQPEHRVVVGAVLGMSCVYYTLFYWQRWNFAPTPEEMADHVTRLLTEPLYRLP